MTALVTAIQPLWPLLKDRDIDPEPLFLASGIRPKQVMAANARVPVEACRAIWSRADALINERHWGVTYGDYWHPSMFGPLGYVWLTSASLREALSRLSRFIDLFLQDGIIDVSEGDNRLTINFNYQNEPFRIPSIADAMISLLMRLCTAIYGRRLAPVGVSLVHPPPDDASAYRAYFGCPVTFGAGCDCLSLPLRAVDKILPGADAHLAALNEQEVIRYLAQLDRGRVVDRVRAKIIEQLPDGQVSSESVAKALHMSRRTLSRQLGREGLSFSSLLQEVRMDLAEAYLASSYHSVAQIAFVLGFSEQAAFSRAFKRWSGESPSAARERLNAA